MSVYLEKIDPEKNSFRFYEIRIEPDLFADRAPVVQWGRIGRPGRVAVSSGCDMAIRYPALEACRPISAKLPVSFGRSQGGREDLKNNMLMNILLMSPLTIRRFRSNGCTPELTSRAAR